MSSAYRKDNLMGIRFFSDDRLPMKAGEGEVFFEDHHPLSFHLPRAAQYFIHESQRFFVRSAKAV
jgi:hypothetical protein